MVRKKYQKKYDCDMQALLDTLASENRAAFVIALSSGMPDAAERFGQYRTLLAKPRRECMELFLCNGETFESIAEHTGYLIDDIPVHIVAGVNECVPEQDDYYVDRQHVGEEAKIDEKYACAERLSVDNIGEESVVRKRHNKAWFPWILAVAAILVAGVGLYMIYGGGKEETVRLEAISPSSSEKPVVEKPVPVKEIPASEKSEEEMIPEEPVTEQPAQKSISNTAIRASIVSISQEEDGVVTSMPLIGRRQYDEYLANAMMPLSEESRGEVTMTFTVNRYGHPSGIRVISLLTHEANQEAIRLLANGPEWAESVRQVTLTIQFQ